MFDIFCRKITPLNISNKTMQAYGAEIGTIYAAKGVEATQELAIRQGRTIGKGIAAGAKKDESWNDTGALKAMMLDGMIAARNDFAKRVVKDMKTWARGQK